VTRGRGQVLTTLAPTGKAAESGQVLAGDVLHAVDATPVRALSTADVIGLVKVPSLPPVLA